MKIRQDEFCPTSQEAFRKSTRKGSRIISPSLMWVRYPNSKITYRGTTNKRIDLKKKNHSWICDTPKVLSDSDLELPSREISINPTYEFSTYRRIPPVTIHILKLSKNKHILKNTRKNRERQQKEQT